MNSVHKITRSPQAPADALAIISLDGMRVGGPGGPMAFRGGARWLVNLVGVGILRGLSIYIRLHEAALSSPYQLSLNL